MAGHAPRARPVLAATNSSTPGSTLAAGPSRIIIAKQTGLLRAVTRLFPDDWAMQLTDQKLIMNQGQTTIECSEPITHAEPSAPVRLEPTDLGFDIGPRRTHGRAVSRWPGMMIREMRARSTPAAAGGRKAQRHPLRHRQDQDFVWHHLRASNDYTHLVDSHTYDLPLTPLP